MAISTTLRTDALTNPTTASLFTVKPTWVAFSSNSNYNIGPNGASNVGGSSFNGALETAATYPNDQYAQITIVTLESLSGFGLLVRGTTTGGGNGYNLTWGSTGMQITNVVNGAASVVLYNSATAGVPPFTAVVGDTILFQIVGNLMTVFRNGAVWCKCVDTTNAHLSGAPGLAGTSAAGNGVYGTWQSGGAVADTVYSPGILVAPPSINMSGGAGWRTCNVPTDTNGAFGPPPTATGVILMTNSASIFVTRKTGSTFNAVPPPAGLTITGGQQLASVAVNMTGATPPVAQFDIWNPATTTGYFVVIVGYYGAETVWVDPPTSVAVPGGALTPASPGTFDITTYCGGTVPAGVIMDIWAVAAKLAPANTSAGEMANWLPAGGRVDTVLIGGGNGSLALVATTTSVTPVMFFRGYVKSGFKWESPAVVSTVPSSASTWQHVPLSAAAAAETLPIQGCLYQASTTGGPLFAVTNGWGTNTAAPNTGVGNGQMQIFGLNPAKVYAQTPLPTFAEQGYFIAPSPKTVAPTTPSGYFSVRSTSQT